MDIDSFWNTIESNAITTVEPSGDYNSLEHLAVQPSNPRVSVESTQPLNSWVSTESTQPLNSWVSVESTQPLNSWVSIENTQPLNSWVSTESTQPLNSRVSVENTQPLNSWVSVKSTQPLNPLVSAERIQPMIQEYSAEIIQPIFCQPQESYSPSSIFQQGFDSEASIPPTQRLVQENNDVIQTFATSPGVADFQAYNCVSSTNYNYFIPDSIPNTNLNPTPPSLPTFTPKSYPNTYPCLRTQRAYSPDSHFQHHFDSEAVRSPFSSDHCATIPLTNTNFYANSRPNTSIYLNIPPSSSSNPYPNPQSHHNLSINSNHRPSTNFNTDALLKNRIRCKNYQKRK